MRKDVHAANWWEIQSLVIIGLSAIAERPASPAVEYLASRTGVTMYLGQKTAYHCWLVHDT